MELCPLPVLGFVAASGTGKTTLLVELIPLLHAQGLRIGIIKHSHHDVDIDQPGKDSHRLRLAGAVPVVLVSPYRRAVITEFSPPQEPRLHRQLACFNADEVDLVLVEGFKGEPYPKIELHRAGLAQPCLYPGDHNIIAVASDTALRLPAALALLDINRPDTIARFIGEWVSRHE